MWLDCCEYYWVFVFVFLNIFGGHKSFFWGPLIPPVMDFWWCLTWFSKLEFLLKWSSALFGGSAQWRFQEFMDGGTNFKGKWQLIITARKRSLWGLCFYTCLSVILFTGGDLHRGGGLHLGMHSCLAKFFGGKLHGKEVNWAERVWCIPCAPPIYQCPPPPPLKFHFWFQIRK